MLLKLIFKKNIDLIIISIVKVKNLFNTFFVYLRYNNK